MKVRRNGGVVPATVAAIVVLSYAALPAAAVSASGDLPAPTSSAPQRFTGAGGGTVIGVRVARHPAYDRVVFNLDGRLPAWSVRYVPRLTENASGRPVQLSGPAVLQVTLQGASAHDEYGASTLRTASTLTPKFPTLRQVRPAGDFESFVNFGLGLRDRVAFRVLGLTSPTRVVVDVAHEPSAAFGAAPVDRAGRAANAVVTGIRTGEHAGYDRAVFDIGGRAVPGVRVAYLPGGSQLDVTLLGSGTSSSSPHASYGGLRSLLVGLPALRQVNFAQVGAGVVTFRLQTAHARGFRVLTLTAPTRIVVDMRH